MENIAVTCSFYISDLILFIVIYKNIYLDYLV